MDAFYSHIRAVTSVKRHQTVTLHPGTLTEIEAAAILEETIVDDSESKVL